MLLIPPIVYYENYINYPHLRGEIRVIHYKPSFTRDPLLARSRPMSNQMVPQPLVPPPHCEALQNRGALSIA